MNDRDHEPFEAELRKLAPAPAPAELMTRLVAAIPQPSTRTSQIPWRLLLRWLAPAAAATALAVALLVWWPSKPGGQWLGKRATASRQTAPKADDIEIDRQLVAAFDAVARLPGGEPVRFRCREWADAVVVRDPARGIVIERRTPRLEVVPVSFETY